MCLINESLGIIKFHTGERAIRATRRPKRSHKKCRKHATVDKSPDVGFHPSSNNISSEMDDIGEISITTFSISSIGLHVEVFPISRRHRLSISLSKTQISYRIIIVFLRIQSFFRAACASHNSSLVIMLQLSELNSIRFRSNCGNWR